MRLLARFLFVSTALSLCGCAPPTIFYWGDYEASVYDRMVENNNTEGEEYLRKTITDAESEAKKVPPGVYADYGFMLYRRGNMAGAIGFFEKEKKAFSESTLLMNTIIEKIRAKQNPAQEVKLPETPKQEKKP